MEEYAFASADLRELLRIDLLFTGDFDRLAIALAWRMATREAVSDSLDANAVASERARFLERTGLIGERLDNWLLGLGRDVVWFNEMLELEGVFLKQREELLSAGSRERMLHTLRMPLMRFNLELIEVDSRDAAHEVFECVSADGEPMEEVASDAGYPYRCSHVFYEDLPEDLQRGCSAQNPEKSSIQSNATDISNFADWSRRQSSIWPMLTCGSGWKPESWSVILRSWSPASCDGFYLRSAPHDATPKRSLGSLVSFPVLAGRAR